MYCGKEVKDIMTILECERVHNCLRALARSRYITIEVSLGISVRSATFLPAQTGLYVVYIVAHDNGGFASNVGLPEGLDEVVVAAHSTLKWLTL